MHSSLGIIVKLNLDMLQSLAAVLSTLKGPWVIGADWNCTPEQLEKTGWLRLVRGKICAPTLATCMERTIDFFVISEDLAPAVHDTVVVSDALSNPHKPARLYLNAAPRQLLVRQLKNVGKFEAKMPFGPEPCRVYPEIEAMLEDPCTTNDDLCTLFTDRMERELIDIYGLDPSLAKVFLGRSSGPSFVWRSALDDEIGVRKSTSVSRAWRRTANWLGDLFKTKNVIAAKLAVSTILTFDHPQPTKEKTTP